MHPVSCQPRFLDAKVEAGCLGRNEALEAIGLALVRDDLAAVVALVCALPEGRRSCPPLVMVKELPVQQWHGLPGLRLAVPPRDSPSMCRFVGLAANDGTPAPSTMSRVRSGSRATSLDGASFDALNRQLEERELMVKSGTILDATLVRAAARQRKEASGARSPREPDADWTSKNGRSRLGCKAPIGVDQGSGLIRKARLKVAGVKDRIAQRSHRNQSAPSVWPARRNRLNSPIRAGVGRVFAIWKRGWGYDRVRNVGPDSNQLQLTLTRLACNIKRTTKLAA
jgi:IS5 family transposase